MSEPAIEKKEKILAEYREHLDRVGKSANTVKAYIHDVGDFAAWFEQTTGEGFAPKLVDPREITEYRGWLHCKGYRPATINRRLIALRRFFDWARKQGRVTGSPFELLEGVHVKEQKDTAPRWLSRNEQLSLLRAVRRGGGVRDLAIVQTLLGTGLRISELAALELSDLEINERSGRLQVRAGKGRKVRSIPLSSRVRKALSAYLEERGDDEEKVFLGQRGPLTEWGIREVVKKYAYHAQLEDVTAHTLRHTFAKDLVDAGTPLDQVAILLGHESLDTTRVYT